MSTAGTNDGSKSRCATLFGRYRSKLGLQSDFQLDPKFDTQSITQLFTNNQKSMDYLFSSAGKKALTTLLAQPALFAFDFDGTLAPLAARPQDTQMSADTRQLLASLCAIVPVAVISGRGCADLSQKLGVQPTYLIGNHGLEGIPDNDALLEQYRLVCNGWHQQWLTRLAPQALATGVILEDKIYSLSLHTRCASDPEASDCWLHQMLPTLQPTPHIIGGKHVFNLMPTPTANKHQALVCLLAREKMRHALFIGDDVTDESVFVNAPSEWLTIRVEPSADSTARFFLRHQDEMQRLLEIIIAQRQ